MKRPKHAPLHAVLLLVTGLAGCGASAGAPHEPDAARPTDAGGERGDGEPSPDARAPSDPDAGSAVDAGPPRDDADIPPPPFMLRVLTLNSWSKGADLVAADVRSAEADVVGLQEVSPAEAEAIAGALGPGWSFVQEDRVNTVAILTRHPILQRIGVVPDGRGGLGASVALGPRLRAHVFVAHLMYTPYGPYQLQDGMAVDDVVQSEEAVRMPELRALLALSAPSVASDEATFLVGDFNAPSHLDYEPAMPWPSSVAPVEAGFVDSYAQLHPDRTKKWACAFAIDDPGITWTQFESSEPRACYDRIDFVYGSANDAEPLESHTIDAASSDHRAVLTTYALRELARGPLPALSLPRDGERGVARHALLSWTDTPGAHKVQVRLGTPDALDMVVETDATHVVTDLLRPDTRYAVRVDAVTPEGVVPGATSTFTTRGGGGLTPDAREYAAGAALALGVEGGDSARDWVGLYERSRAYGAGHPAADWAYLNDDQAAPSAPVASGTVTLTAPAEPGEYVLRFFHDDGYVVEDEVGIRVR